MIDVIFNIISLFLIVGVGYFAGKKGILTKNSNEHLSKLMVNITSPMLIFSSFSIVEINNEVLQKLVYLVIGTIIITLVATVASYLMKGRLLQNNSKNDTGIYMALLTGINSTFMGIPVVIALMGPDQVYLIIIAGVVLTIALYSICEIQVSYGAKEHLTMKDAAKKMLNVNSIAAIAGVIVMVARINVPEFLLNSMEQVGLITAPLAMIIVGLGFSESHVFQVFKNKTLLYIAFLKMIVWPLIIFAIVYFIDLPGDVKAILVITGILPSAIAIGPLTQQAGGNVKLASEGIMFTTFISLFTIPIMGIFVVSYFI